MSHKGNFKMFEVKISHGTKRYNVAFDSETIPTSEELSGKLAEITGVPSTQQKIIHKGDWILYSVRKFSIVGLYIVFSNLKVKNEKAIYLCLRFKKSNTYKTDKKKDMEKTGDTGHRQ